jgi:ABC-2 type transport system permease protein
MNHHSFVAKVRYYVLLFQRITSISISSMLIYRANVLFFFVFESLFLMANIVGLTMGVEFAGGTLAGWSLDQVLFVAMLFQVGHQIFTTFALSGLFHIGWYVWSGRMDYVLLKPLHPLIGMHTATEFIISNIPNVVINFSVFVWITCKLYLGGQVFTVTGTIGLGLFFLLGMAVRYGIALLVVSPAFFAEKLAEGEDAYWSLQSLAKYPTGVFPRVMQNIFSFVLPLAVIAAIPASVFFGKESLWSAGRYFLAATVFTWVAFEFFKRSVVRYQSVNTGA